MIVLVSLSLQQAEEKQRNNSIGSGFPSNRCPGPAVPLTQSTRSSVPYSPNAPLDNPPDVPKARSSVFSQLGQAWGRAEKRHQSELWAHLVGCQGGVLGLEGPLLLSDSEPVGLLSRDSC